MTSTADDTREQVRARYAAAAVAVTTGQGCGADDSGRCSAGCCAPECGSAASRRSGGRRFGAGLYSADEKAELPAEAFAASLGCGNPLAVADLRPGETVLDLGSGGGIDVLLSARRVGAEGFAYGVDMTDEMLALARANAEQAGAEQRRVPSRARSRTSRCPTSPVDVVISNCVINLSVDKPAVLAEMFRVLRPGGRIGISDVVAEDHLSAEQRADRGSYVGCIAGALSRAEYLDGLAGAGFAEASVTFTQQAADGMHTAIIRAGKPR